MKSKRTIIYLLLSVFIAIGCAGNHRPICDTQGVDINQFEADLADCQNYARQISPGERAGVGAAIGAGLGALVGLTVGIAFNIDDKGSLAAFGAALGGLQGATEGGASGVVQQKVIVNKCMTERGYKVLE